MTDQKTFLRQQIYVSLGMSDKEARLYDLLLEQGETSGGELEKLSGFKKNTYTLLKRLERRGLVLTSNKDGKRHYLPSSPDVLMSLLTEQRRSVAQVQASMEALLPELWATYRAKIGRPVVSYYSGISGLRVVFDQVYAEGKREVWGVFGNEMPSKKFFDEILNKYEPLRVQRGIRAITISPDSLRARQLKDREQEDLKEKYLVDPQKYPMPAEFDTWGEYIALMSFTKGQFASLLIEHPALAQTMQSVLRLLADLLRERDGERSLVEKTSATSA